MALPHDKTGERHGALTVLRRFGTPGKYGQSLWLVRCDCGRERALPHYTLGGYRKPSSACVCAQRDKALARERLTMEDLTGRRFGRWTVVKYIGYSQWLVRCECGAESSPKASRLRDGQTQSCGCRLVELDMDRRTHGHTISFTTTPTYRSWLAMRNRCSRPDTNGYKNYGGRGIRVCAEWESSFEAFVRDMGERPDGTSIDRVDTDGNYEPGNCRWATAAEQAANRRHKARSPRNENGVNWSTVTDRVRRGWSAREATTKPAIARLRKLVVDEAEVIRLYEIEGLLQSEIGDRYGVSGATISRMLIRHGIVGKRLRGPASNRMPTPTNSQ